MTRVILKRAYSSDKVTLGMLQISGVEHPPIFTLENPLRGTKEDSRIPSGHYYCSPFSGVKFKDVYLVENVPERDYILFHSGNTEKDTLGCILLGLSAGSLNGESAVLESRKAMDLFRSLIGKKRFRLIIT